MTNIWCLQRFLLQSTMRASGCHSASISLILHERIACKAVASPKIRASRCRLSGVSPQLPDHPPRANYEASSLRFEGTYLVRASIQLQLGWRPMTTLYTAGHRGLQATNFVLGVLCLRAAAPAKLGRASASAQPSGRAPSAFAPSTVKVSLSAACFSREMRKMRWPLPVRSFRKFVPAVSPGKRQTSRQAIR